KAMLRALDQAKISPHEVQYLECHSTGTSVGDQSEVNAISSVYHSTPLAIGSVKSQIGHTIGAAGAAGLLKVVLALQARKLPPTRMVSDLTPFQPIQIPKP